MILCQYQAFRFFKRFDTIYLLCSHSAYDWCNVDKIKRRKKQWIPIAKFDVDSKKISEKCLSTKNLKRSFFCNNFFEEHFFVILAKIVHFLQFCLIHLKTFCYSCNKITTTWIQIFRQNWNGFFSNASSR